MAGLSPYATALELKRVVPDWIKNTEDQARVQAYNTYWDIFVNVKEAFSIILREDDGEEKSRRFVPAARTIIEATNRYLAKGPTVTPGSLVTNPDGTTIEADEAAIAGLMKLMNDFFKREEFFTKFGSMKRWLLVRGDSLLHLTADDTKPEGQRLRLVELDPSSYFTLPDPMDDEKITGVYIVTIVSGDDPKDLIAQRQAYLKDPVTGRITTKLEFFKRDAWDDRWPFTVADLEKVAPPSRFAGQEALLNGFELDARITSIPVYHYRNRRQGGMPFGLSELQGIETLLAGIVQTATDEDITISETGVGMFVTTSGSPRDAQGNEVPWVIAPASVLQLQSINDKFDRVKGVDSIQPLLDHLGMLKSEAQETTGTPDIAVGKIDVQVAQSGIALAIQMAPILAKNEETEQELKGRTEQLLYDMVNMWLPVFEGYTPVGISLNMTFDDPIPNDRAAIMKEILDMLTAKAISVQFAQKLLKERLGYDIPADMVQQMADENTLLLDSVGGRLAAEAAPPADTAA